MQMKIKFFLSAVVCLFILSVTGYAQLQAQPNFAELRKSPVMQQNMKNASKTALRSFWDSKGANLMVVGLMSDPDIRAALGVSDEQSQEIQGIPMRIGADLQNHPEFKGIVEEMHAIQNPTDPFLQNADPQTQQKFQELTGKVSALSMSIMTDAIDKAITPEQKQKVNESLLANLSEMPIVSPNMFEALDLTDDQRQQMEAIKKELEPEFENNLESYANGAIIMMNKMFDEMEKQGLDFQNLTQGVAAGDPEGRMDRVKAMQEKILPIQKKLMEDPEFKKISEEINSKGKAFSTKFNTKMFDVLTDEQWNRLQKLIDDPPEYAKALGKKIKEQQAASEQAAPWQPGPNSWKPGDPIPEGYRQQRQERGRFPRPTKNQSP